MESVFYYPVTLHRGAVATPVVAAWAQSLPNSNDIQSLVLVLSSSEGTQEPGMYLWDGSRWRLTIPYQNVAYAIINGAQLDLYFSLSAPVQTPTTGTVDVWRNAIEFETTTLASDNNLVWGVSYVPTEGAGSVTSVNNVGPDGTGNVSIAISNIPGLQTALANAGSVKTVDGQSPDANGNIVVRAQDNNAASGVSLIADSGATTGNIKLTRLVAGSGITLAADANGNLKINGSSQGVTQVTSEGTGTSLIGNDGTTGGIAILKSLAAGSNITITPDAQNHTLTITANQAITPATTSALGGVIVKAGLSVDGTGNLSLAAPTGVNLGGVKAGTGISIAADGTISASGAVASVSGQTGTVVVQASDTSTASGTSLISDSGATTGNIKIKRVVAGSNITLAADGNGNLRINSTLTSAVTSFATGTSGQLVGDIVFAAGQAISLSNTGNTIQINGTGVPEAPNDGTLYGRQNMGWTAIPSTANPIVAVNGQTGTGAVLLVEASPPANTAVIKSLVAGANVSISDNSGLITITASIPGGTVATVNSKGPDGSGNVTLAASDVSALPIVGGTMGGAINMNSFKVTGLPTPTVGSDAVPLSLITGLVIDGGVIG